MSNLSSSFRSTNTVSTAVRLDNNDLYYLKVMRVLVNALPAELRRLFKEVWDKENKDNPWQDDENSGKLLFDKYKPKDLIKRLDDKIKAGRRDDWDMTVLSRVFIYYTFFKDKKYNNNVDKLRELRNKYSHVASTRSRTQVEFDADLKKIKSVFNDLGLSEEALNDALNIPEAVDQQQLRDEMKQLQEKLCQELIEEMKATRADIRQMHDRIDQFHGEMNDRFDQLLSLQGAGAGAGAGRGPSAEDRNTSSVNSELPEAVDQQQLGDEMTEPHEQPRGEIHDGFDQLQSLQGAGSGVGPSDEATSSANTALPEWFERLPVSTRQMRMTEQDLVKICKHLGKNWQLVAVHLGITQPQLDRVQEANRSLMLEMIAVFRMWIQRESRNATREAFIKALFAFNETCTIEWDKIERVMSQP